MENQSNITNQEQIEYWNGEVGQRWRDYHSQIEAMLSPFTKILFDEIGDIEGKNALDIGCGAGETSQILSQSGANVTGIDISAPLLSIARNRNIANSNFIEADATIYEFEADKFDRAISRFGVMFFIEPITSFLNISKSLKTGAKLRFVCWQSPNQNQWVYAPLKALDGIAEAGAAQHPDDPGPFAFARKERVTEILTNSGFKDITHTPHMCKMQFAPNTGLHGGIDYLTKMGPASRAFTQLSEDKKEIAKAKLADSLKEFVKDNTLQLDGAIWLVEAIKI